MPEDKNQPSTENPYDFIMKDAPKQKRSLLPKTNDKKQRVIIMVGAGLALLTVLIIVFSLILGIGGGGIDNLRKLAKEQQEIIRVAELGEEGARSGEIQSIAVSTKLSVSSSQTEVLNYLSGQGSELKKKDLDTEIDLATDDQLQSAADNGQFDEVYAVILSQLLSSYRANLTNYYDQTSSNSQKTILENAYQQSEDILTDESLQRFIQ